jgi:tripartite-type tricarboxylate transporter receptor subunit TctC
MSAAHRLITFFAVAFALASGSASAQDAWPARPVKVVVPSSPGGGTDVFGRLLAGALAEATKQQFVVENRPGASGNIGAQAVANAPKDGYTFLVASNSSTAINLFLLKDQPFDVRKALTAVARGVYAISVLIVNNDLKANSVAEFIALAKARPEDLAYGTPGTGSAPYLGVRMMEELAGLKFVHAPYKGIGPAYQDLIAGRLQFIYADLASALPFVQSGRVRALAVDRRTPLLPNVPTLAESGMPKFDAPISFSVLAPAGTPEPILKRMAEETQKALKALAPRLEQVALVPVYDTPAEFAAGLEQERSMWSAFIQRNAITGE